MGTATPIFYLYNWCTELHTFLWKIQVKFLVAPDYQTYQSLHNNNKFLMGKFNKYLNSISILTKVNQVRIWLQVNTIANIATADGRDIEKISWQGTHQQKIIHTLWPVQTQPDEQVFQHWRKFFSLTFLRYQQQRITKKSKGSYPLNQLGRLAQPCQMDLSQI